MEQRRMLHLGLLSDLKPYCPLPVSPNTASLPWRKLTAAQVLLRVRLWSSPVCPCKQHAFGTSHPGASPALVMGYWTCRWEKESLRQELSLSGGCLVTLMENELWGPYHRNHSLSWRAHWKTQVPWEGVDTASTRAVTKAHMCGWWQR